MITKNYISQETILRYKVSILNMRFEAISYKMSSYISPNRFCVAIKDRCAMLYLNLRGNVETINIAFVDSHYFQSNIIYTILLRNTRETRPTYLPFFHNILSQILLYLPTINALRIIWTAPNNYVSGFCKGKILGISI